MKLIETKTLTSAQPSITFSGIPQNFADLYVLVSVRTVFNNSGTWWDLNVRFNGSTSGYSNRTLYGTGTGVGSLSESFIRIRVNTEGTTSNTFANSSLYIPNYAGSANKSVSADSVSEANAATAWQGITAGLWTDTSAINSIAFIPDSGDVQAGTTISLYGIGGVGDGYAAPKATGGTISYTPGYVVHTFTASGTFTPTTNLTNVEYLVIAGGGGGGKNIGGAGGAGGYRSSVTGESSGGASSPESKLSLTSGTGYTVTVGAGGAGSTNNEVRAAAGSNSVFGSITSNGGGGGHQFGQIGQTGGSGSGGGGDVAGGTGTANQGSNGGAGFSNGGAGGGGGALSAGSTGASSSIGGAGGAGISSSITGSSVTRAGGGGGGGGFLPSVGGAAGTGGAGTGGSSGGNGTDATVNTGSGGGGGSWLNLGTANGGSGASGIVIVRYAA